MTRRFLTAASATLAVLLITSLATPALAAGRAFSAEATAVAISSDGNVTTFDIKGVASEIGPFTGQVVNTVQANGKQTSTFYFQNANGDTIYFTLSARQVGDTLVGKYKVEGGTGQFAGAKGDGEATVTFTDVPGVVLVSLEGELK
jgi:hypothetical protein